ncbi:hypothetical protein KSC_098550 [Ktedonobacter sp. SOSP1-52]|uniref:SgcJ/EcaC family oxidoreductase n=1 Tax=Ktedonobacter sp. SOSP1-52 TaxID=2778366 RepID=UPI0019159BBD|nr:SgcJ/EcaC family oxidoreductase [Ktedonobacter sp. SOSP1-52]GHO70963.1 hypothetical protein KSC_098550 [Ktedonobacter sp. SOSP1-52]
MTHTDDNTTFSTDVEAIQNVLQQLVLCWNRGDGQSYGECFTEDADYIDVMGTHSHSREVIARLHQLLFDGPLKGSQLEGYGNVRPIVKFLAPTVALIIGGGTSRLEGQSEVPADRQSVNTTVLIKRDGQWKIRAFQNNRVMSHAFQSGGPTQRGEQ